MKSKSLFIAFLSFCLSIASLQYLTCGETQAFSDNGKEHSAWGLPKPQKQLLIRIGYVVSHDPNWKIPHWVSYHLTKHYVKAEALVPGKPFKADPDLPPGQRAELADYKNSGYDRGHLARQADMRGRNKQCEFESCYLSNIAPQLPSLNQKIWLHLENKVQKWAEKFGGVWVITGPIFKDGKIRKTIGSNRVAVPAQFYKIVVRNVHGKPEVLAFIIDQNTPCNDETKRLTQFLTSVNRVEELTGLNFLRELPDDIEDAIEAAVPQEIWN